MAIDERFGVIRMIVASIYVTDPGVGKLDPWDDFAELE